MTARDLSALPDDALLDGVRGMFDATDPVPPGLAERVRTVIDGQPIQYTVVRYRCPHCPGFVRSSRKAVVEHIARCWRNPAVRACKTCAFHQEAHASTPAEWCFPGRSCDCNDFDEACTHEDGPEEFTGIVANCPLWNLRGDR